MFEVEVNELIKCDWIRGRVRQNKGVVRELFLERGNQHRKTQRIQPTIEKHGVATDRLGQGNVDRGRDFIGGLHYLLTNFFTIEHAISIRSRCAAGCLTLLALDQRSYLGRKHD